MSEFSAAQQQRQQAAAARARDKQQERQSLRLAKKSSRGKSSLPTRAISGRATRGQGTWSKTGRVVGLLLKIHAGSVAGDSYSERAERSALIATNMLGQTSRDRAEEWSVDCLRHPCVSSSNLFCHLSLSRPVGGDLTSDQWRRVTFLFLQKIGVDGQFVSTRHSNSSNDHIHIVFSRSKKNNGKLVSMSNNRWAWREVVREVEKELGLQVLDQVIERPTPTPTSDRVVSSQRRATRLGAQDPFINPHLISQCLAESESASQLSAALKRAGIEMKTSSKNGKTTGVLFKKSDANEWLAGSSIGREFSLPKLEAALELNRKSRIEKRGQGRLNQQRQAAVQSQIQQVQRPRGG